MERLVFTLTFILLPHFALAANQCINLFKSNKITYDSFSVDSTSMNNIDYLMLQHRRWQQRNKIEFYTKEQLHEFAIRAKQGDQVATENLIVSNIPLVVKEVSKKVSSHNPIFPELVSSALISVYKAIETFEPNHPKASFLNAIKWQVQNVLKNHRKDDEVIDYGVSYYNDIKNHFMPIKYHYERLGQTLTAKTLVNEYKQRFDIDISLSKARDLLLNPKYSTVREDDRADLENKGFSLNHLESREDGAKEFSNDVAFVHKLIDQMKAEIADPVHIKVFELYYNLTEKARATDVEVSSELKVTEKGGLTDIEIASELNLSQSGVKWIVREKIRKAVKKVLEPHNIDRELLKEGLVTYPYRSLNKVENKTQPKKTYDINAEFDQVYRQYLNNRPAIEVVKQLKQIEPQVLRSHKTDLIFEYHYLMAEILLEAKKYDLASHKAQEVLKIGRDWNESHQGYMMLHYISGKSAYHTGNFKKAEEHLRKSLAIKGAIYEAWFYYTKTIEQLNNSLSFTHSFQSYILYMTVLHRLEALDNNTLTPKDIDQFKTIEHLAIEGLSKASKELRDIHGLRLLSLKQISSYTKAAIQKDAQGVVNALLPLHKGLKNIPLKKLKKLRLEGPTAKAFHIFMIGLATNLRALNRTQEFERVVKFLEEL